MNVMIVPGYGDRHDYLTRAIRHWPKKYELNPVITVFGWSGEAESFEEKWQQFEQKLQHLGNTAIVGISAGASVALRALQLHPELVSKVITICGPVHPERMNIHNLHANYPLLERSLDHLSLDNLPVERVMTLRPRFDEVVPIDAMKIEGASDIHMGTIGHAISIVWAMYGRGRTIAEFVNSA